MDTKSAAAAVIGGRHARVARNGQDAAAAWAHGQLGVAVVCDGCGSGQATEVGARLAAELVVAELARALAAGADATDLAMWRGVRAAVVGAIGGLVERMRGDRERALHDQFLFTIVAAARSGDRVAVWAVGDGAYALGDRETVLGPFADNEPPYVAYDLLGAAPHAHFATAHASCGRCSSRPMASPTSASRRCSTARAIPSRIPMSSAVGSRCSHDRPNASIGTRGASCARRRACKTTVRSRC